MLEVGSAWGYSAITMARVARSLVSVDPHIALATWDAFQANLQAHGVAGRVTALRMESRAALPNLHLAGRRFDLIFIDGDHSPAAVTFDATWARALVTVRGVIAFHDYNPAQFDTVYEGLLGWREPDRLVESLAVFEGPWL